jgi:ribosome maturation factor RimP
VVTERGQCPRFSFARSIAEKPKEERGVTDQHGAERVRSAVEVPLSEAGFELVDVERQGPVLKVTVDREGGVDLEAVTEATRVVNAVLDAEDLLGAQTGLEVSSPGIERPLRTPAHFRRFVGTEVAVKARAGTEGERRISGVLEGADDEGVVVAGRRLAYADIEKARTVFVWPAQPKKKMGRAS